MACQASHNCHACDACEEQEERMWNAAEVMLSQVSFPFDETEDEFEEEDV